jgi:predicted nucleotidyltransferase
MFPFEHCQYHGDYIVYELRKFIGLARDCNPNIIELLFADPKRYSVFNAELEHLARTSRIVSHQAREKPLSAVTRWRN